MPEPPQSEAASKNGAGTIAKVLNQLNLPTLAMIMLFGGGNFLATKQTSDEQRVEVNKALRQIEDLHDALDAFEKRQKDVLQKTGQSLENQTQMLRNQSTMLDNQMRLIEQMRKNPQP